MKKEIQLYPDFPTLSIENSGNLIDNYIVALFYIVIIPEIISDIH